MINFETQRNMDNSKENKDNGGWVSLLRMMDDSCCNISKVFDKDKATKDDQGLLGQSSCH